MNTVKFLGLFLFIFGAQTTDAMAFPLTSTVNAEKMFTLELAAPGFVTDGVVAMSNCSASYVTFKGRSMDARGLVLTNGHCVGSPFGGMLRPGEFLSQRPQRFSLNLLDRGANRIATLRSEKIIYATMTGTDLAVLELTQTYRQIESATGVTPLEIIDEQPQAGEVIDIPSGYWRRTYNCAIDGFVHELREADWTFKNSIRYSESGCEVIGGTSGSPIRSVRTGQVIGINNTGNESGQRCTMNNPCEVDTAGNVSIIPGRGYGQQIYVLYSCLNAAKEIDLAVPTCVLPK